MRPSTTHPIFRIRWLTMAESELRLEVRPPLDCNRRLWTHIHGRPSCSRDVPIGGPSADPNDYPCGVSIRTAPRPYQPDHGRHLTAIVRVFHSAVSSDSANDFPGMAATPPDGARSAVCSPGPPQARAGGPAGVPLKEDGDCVVLILWLGEVDTQECQCKLPERTVDHARALKR